MPRTTHQIEPLQVTIADAAKLLSYCPRTIYELVASGQLRAVGQHRMKRISVEELRRWQSENSV